jgi:manganese transport protein
MDSEPPPTTDPAWRKPAGRASLQEVHRSIVVPTTASFWRKLFAFSGPGFLIAVGYMDPGNWATDLQGGAQYGYTLLSVVMISNLMAILLQHSGIKLGVATGPRFGAGLPRPLLHANGVVSVDSL